MQSNNNSSGTIIAIIAIGVMMLLAVGCIVAIAGVFFYARVDSVQQIQAPPRALRVEDSHGLSIEVMLEGGSPWQSLQAALPGMKRADTSQFSDWKIVGRNQVATIYLLTGPQGPTAAQLDQRDEIIASLEPHLPAEATVQAAGDSPVEMELDKWAGETQATLNITLKPEQAVQLGITAADVAQVVKGSGLSANLNDKSSAKLSELTLETPGGDTVLLREVAEFTVEEEPAVVVY